MDYVPFTNKNAIVGPFVYTTKPPLKVKCRRNIGELACWFSDWVGFWSNFVGFYSLGGFMVYPQSDS